MTYARLEAADREPKQLADHTGRWEQLQPVASVNGTIEARVRAFCDEKRISLGALTALGARVATRREGRIELAFAGDNGAGRVIAIKYRPLDGTSHESRAEQPSAWLRPIIVGKRDSLDWLVCEGETDGARLYDLVGDTAAVLVLPAGALAFKPEWAAAIPRGANVALCHDADEDGDAGAAKAAGIIGGSTFRLRPPISGGDWCDWAGNRDDFLALAAEAQPDRPALRTRGVVMERVRPVRWLWSRRIPMGLPSLIVGEEGIGKGTLTAWIVARATRGELEGDYQGQPARVLIVGDEDAFDPIWVPRLYAAGADLAMVRTLDDGEIIDDFAAVYDALKTTIEREEIGLVLLDALLDHIPAGSDGAAIYNPKAVRQALVPLRRVVAATNVAAVGLLHPIKGNPSSFRQLVAGSHQFNAVSRSSLLLAADPEDENMRVLVRGKGNHSAAPRSIEFQIVADVVDLAGYTFETPKVVNLAEGERTVKDLLKSAPVDAPIRDELAPQLEQLLTDEPQGTGVLASAVGRDPKDGSVRNTLAWLVKQGRAKQPGRGKWTRP